MGETGDVRQRPSRATVRREAHRTVEPAPTPASGGRALIEGGLAWSPTWPWLQAKLALALQSAALRRLLLVAGLLGIPALSGFLRGYRLATSLDFYIDELTYTDITRHLALQGRLGTEAGPFFLHPIGFFALAALWWRFAHISGDLVQQIAQLRMMSVVIASAIALLVFFIAYRVAGLAAAFVAGLLVAIDPFAVRWTSMVMLEPASILWSLAGLAILANAAVRERTVSPGEAAWAGLLFGCSMTTKDMAVFATLVPAAGFTLLARNVLPVRRLLVVGGYASAVYLAYMAYVAGNGGLHRFVVQKTRGLRRMAGLLQESGFHQRGSISFSQALLQNVDRYAFTYLIMAAGVLAAVVLIWRGRSAGQRLVACWVLGPAALLAFAVLQGTLEDHFFLYLLIPSVLAAPMLLPWVRTMWAGDTARRRLAAGLAFVLLAGLVSDTLVWTHLRSSPDNGYQRLIAFLDHDLPSGSRIGVDHADPLWWAARETQPSIFLQGQGLAFQNEILGPWQTRRSLQRHRARYMVVNQKLLAEHLQSGPMSFYRWLPQNGRLIFRVREDSYRELDVYELPAGFWSA